MTFDIKKCRERDGGRAIWGPMSDVSHDVDVLLGPSSAGQYVVTHRTSNKREYGWYIAYSENLRNLPDPAEAFDPNPPVCGYCGFAMIQAMSTDDLVTSWRCPQCTKITDPPKDASQKNRDTITLTELAERMGMSDPIPAPSPLAQDFGPPTLACDKCGKPRVLGQSCGCDVPHPTREELLGIVERLVKAENYELPGLTVEAKELLDPDDPPATWRTIAAAIESGEVMDPWELSRQGLSIHCEDGRVITSTCKTGTYDDLLRGLREATRRVREREGKA